MIKYIIGICIFYISFTAGYQLRKYETSGMQDMYTKLLEQKEKLLREEQRVAAECLDDLDICREDCVQ